MSDLEKIELLRTMLEDNTEDENVLLAFLHLAGNRILAKAYPFDSTVEEVPPRYVLTQVEIAAYLMNKRGAEGETYHGENGVNRTYETASIPASMLAGVTPFCGGVTV